MTWLGAVLHLWAEDYCFKHHKKREGFYITRCPDCERQKRSRLMNPYLKTELAKIRLGWQ